jgi:hypothetical protein
MGRKSLTWTMLKELKENPEMALKELTQRSIISNSNGTVPVRRPEIIRYYANTIAHHFESKLDSGNEKYLPNVQSVI